MLFIQIIYGGINYLHHQLKKLEWIQQTFHADKSKMNLILAEMLTRKFDIKGSGQGINSIKNSPKVSELITEISNEFKEACLNFDKKTSNF